MAIDVIQRSICRVYRPGAGGNFGGDRPACWDQSEQASRRRSNQLCGRRLTCSGERNKSGAWPTGRRLASLNFANGRRPAIEIEIDWGDGARKRAIPAVVQWTSPTSPHVVSDDEIATGSLSSSPARSPFDRSHRQGLQGPRSRRTGVDHGIGSGHPAKRGIDKFTFSRSETTDGESTWSMAAFPIRDCRMPSRCWSIGRGWHHVKGILENREGEFGSAAHVYSGNPARIRWAALHQRCRPE